MTSLIHFDYFRSSASYRVRIAINVKGIEVDRVSVNLLEGGQRAPDYLEKNPAGLVPLLMDDGQPLSQSIAMIEYLEEKQPNPPLLPADPFQRAYVRAMALSIACDIHPLNNLRVLKYLQEELSLDKDARNQWYAHWVSTGFDALETPTQSRPQCWRFLFWRRANDGRYMSRAASI